MGVESNSSADQPQRPIRDRATGALRRAGEILPDDLKEGVGIVFKGRTADGEEVSRGTRAAEGAKVTAKYLVPGAFAVIEGPLAVAAGVGALGVEKIADNRVKKDKEAQEGNTD